ncbi:hypothetical protein RUND412_003386 [Rhizina undulata]
MKHSSALVFLVLAFLTFFTITSMAHAEAEAEASPQRNTNAPTALPLRVPRKRVVEAESSSNASAAGHGSGIVTAITMMPRSVDILFQILRPSALIKLLQKSRSPVVKELRCY